MKKEIIEGNFKEPEHSQSDTIQEYDPVNKKRKNCNGDDIII